MKESLSKRCKLFAENRGYVKKAMTWESANMYPLCASLFTARNQTAKEEKIVAGKRLLKEKTGFFSDFRGTTKPVLICELAIAEDMNEKMTQMLHAFDSLEKHFATSEYLTTAAMSMTNLSEPSEYERIAEKTRKIYDQMKSNHPFLTSDEDSSFAALLALSPKAEELIEGECEECYKILKPHFFSADAVQSLSHVLALGEGSPTAKCEKALSLYDKLKKAGLKYGTGYELATLGVLALIDASIEELVSEMKEVDAFLSKQKGFGLFGIGKKQRVMYAGILTMCDYVPDLSTMQTSATTGAISLIVAQQAAMMASIVAASVAASSNSSTEVDE